MDLSVFFYTYSTIAQTLAGAFGFLVAVVLYRMQAIAMDMQGSGAEFETCTAAPHSGLKQMRAREQWDRYVEHAEGVLGGYHPPGARSREELKDGLGRVKDALTILKSTKSSLRRSLYWTAGTIVASLTLLPATYWLASWDTRLPWILLVAAVASAIFTISTYVRLAVGTTR